MDSTNSGTTNGTMAGAGPINRPSLHEETVERLRNMIFDGELIAGDRVPERELCHRFDISRTPLREALKVIASEGLITLLPNRGARVSQLTIQDIDEVFPVMGALDALSGELACARITDVQIAEIKALHYQMALHHTRGERSEYFRLNQEIHERILKAAGNRTLATVFRGLSGRIRRARYMANISQARWNQAMGEHEQILDSLIARDGPRLGMLLKDHLTNKCAAVKDAICSASQSAFEHVV